MPRLETITGPVYFASYFINGDASGLDHDEKQQADFWIRHHGVASVVGMEEDSERFTWHYALYMPGTPFSGGQVCDYYCRPLAAAMEG